MGALTALFTALANAAGAYAKRLEMLPLFKKWEYEDEIDSLQEKIKTLRATGGADNFACADAMRLRVEKLSKRIEHLSDADSHS